jgi:hypothetical protein
VPRTVAYKTDERLTRSRFARQVPRRQDRGSCGPGRCCGVRHSADHVRFARSSRSAERSRWRCSDPRRTASRGRSIPRRIQARDGRHGVGDHERDQLLGKLVRTVVIRAVRDDDGESIRVAVRPDEVIAGCFRRRVRRSRVVRRCLREDSLRRRATRRPRRWKRARTGPCRHAMLSRAVQQDGRSVDVRADEGERIRDRSIDVALRREMHDDVNWCSSKRRARDRRHRDVAVDETVVRRLLDLSSDSADFRRRSARPDSRIELRMRRHHPKQKVRSDEPGSARNQDGLRGMQYWWRCRHEAALLRRGGT